MSTALTYTKTGTKATVAAKLDKAIFDVEVKNHELLQQAYLAHQANGRIASANTKSRGMVRGGGIKPWRQKGTGRARVGSIRSPIWRGGGIIFGPTGEQNFKHYITTTSKRQAVRQALSLAAESKKIIVLEALDTKMGKTKLLAALLTKVGATGTTLLVVEAKDEALVRISRNIQDLKVVQASYLNVVDILDADHIVLTDGGLTLLTTHLNTVKTGSTK